MRDGDQDPGDAASGLGMHREHRDRTRRNTKPQTHEEVVKNASGAATRVRAVLPLLGTWIEGTVSGWHSARNCRAATFLKHTSEKRTVLSRSCPEVSESCAHRSPRTAFQAFTGS